jgi:tetratricopeptide (TPR) repeat protein
MKNFLFLFSVLLVTVSFGQTAEEYYNKAEKKYELQDYKGAIVEYTKAIQLNPTNVDAYYNRGFTKYNLDDFKGAIEDYTKAITLNPIFNSAYYSRGVAKANL